MGEEKTVYGTVSNGQTRHFNEEDNSALDDLRLVPSINLNLAQLPGRYKLI